MTTWKVSCFYEQDEEDVVHEVVAFDFVVVDGCLVFRNVNGHNVKAFSKDDWSMVEEKQ